MVFGNQPSEPRRKALPEPIESEQADTSATLHRGPCLRGVIAPIGQEEADVRQIGVGGDVLERLKPVFDEPQTWPPSIDLLYSRR